MSFDPPTVILQYFLQVPCFTKQAIFKKCYRHSGRLCRVKQVLECLTINLHILIEESIYSAWPPIYLLAPQQRHLTKLQIREWQVEKHLRK